MSAFVQGWLGLAVVLFGLALLALALVPLGVGVIVVVIALAVVIFGLALYVDARWRVREAARRREGADW